MSERDNALLGRCLARALRGARRRRLAKHAKPSRSRAEEIEIRPHKVRFHMDGNGPGTGQGMLTLSLWDWIGLDHWAEGVERIIGGTVACACRYRIIIDRPHRLRFLSFLLSLIPSALTSSLKRVQRAPLPAAVRPQNVSPSPLPSRIACAHPYLPCTSSALSSLCAFPGRLGTLHLSLRPSVPCSPLPVSTLFFSHPLLSYPLRSLALPPRVPPPTPPDASCPRDPVPSTARLAFPLLIAPPLLLIDSPPSPADKSYPFLKR